MYTTSNGTRINPAYVSTIGKALPADREGGYPFVAKMNNGDVVRLTLRDADDVERAVRAHNAGLANLKTALYEMMAQTA